MEALDLRVNGYDRLRHSGRSGSGLSPVHCVEAVREATYDRFAGLVDEATCWVPTGYRLAPRLVAQGTGAVRE